MNLWQFDLTTLVVVGLATWRMSVLLVREQGPWRLSQRLREAFGVEHTEDGDPVSYPDGSPLACVWCLSMWLTVPSYLLTLVAAPVVFLAACAGLAALLERHNG